ncbi:hypothetical protein D3C84_403220 [compost metagenome]
MPEEGQLAARHTENSLGLEQLAATDDYGCVQAGLRRIHGQVAARVAEADDQDFAFHLLHIAVFAGMNGDPGEAPAHFRNLAVPQVTVGNQYAGVMLAGAVAERHLPTGFAVFTQRNETAHFGVERDFLAQAEGVGVVVHVRLDLVAARVNRIVGRHGEAVEAGAAFRSDQMQGIVVGVPVTADVPRLLETVHVEAGVGHGLQGGKASGPGANDAIVIGHYDSPFLERWKRLLLASVA